MKTFKRTLSGFLALLMMFSCFSVLSNAALNDGNKNSAEVYTDFYVEKDGVWEKTDKVKAGQKVKARVSIGTDYLVGSTALFWVYSKNFMDFDHSGMNGSVDAGFDFQGTLNPDSIAATNKFNGLISYFTDVPYDSIADYLIYDGYVGEDYFDDKGWVMLNMQSATAVPAQLSKDEYVFEFNFTVKDNPTATEGFFYIPEESLASPDAYYAPTQIQRAGSDTDIAPLPSEYGNVMYYNTVLKDKNTITLFTETSTTYTQNVYTMDTEGYYSAPAVTKTPTVEIGSTISASAYAAPDGFTVDTAKSSADVTAAEDGSSVMNVYLKREKYNVSFDGVPTEQFYDAVIKAETPDEKEGYTFDGWYSGANKLTEATKVPVGGAAYTAKYTANDVGYTVNKYFMNTDGSTYADPVPQAFPGKTDAVVSYADENIDGFKLDTTLGKLSGTVTGDGKLVLEAYYTREKVNVTIDGKTTQQYYGTTVEKPATPPAEAGYEFDKWVDGSNNEIGSWPIAVKTTDIVINSVFKKLPRTVTYKYVGAPSGYEVPAAKIAYIGDPIELPQLPTVEGYAVGNWVITDANGKVITDGKVGTTDVTVTSTWTLNGYKVTLDLDGGEANVTSINKNYGEVLHADELPEVTKAGYDHVGWTADGADATFPMTIKGDVALKAKLALHNYTITYAFSGNKPDSVNVPAAVTGTMGSVIPQPTFGAVEGWSFGGWTFADAEGNEITDGKVGTADVVATGKWTLNRHQVSYVTGVDGTTIAPITRPYGTEILAPETDLSALKPGYRFDGWKDSETGKIVTFPFAMPDRDVELVAVWTPVERTITYVYVGAPSNYTAPEAKKGTIGTAIELPDLPTDEAYIISNWVISGDDGNGKVGTTDVTVTATWTKKTYTVQFYADEAGTVPFGDPVTYEHGDLLVYPENEPTPPAGQLFDFWLVDEGTVVKSDLDIVPEFYDIEYLVKVLNIDGIEFAETNGWKATYGEEITLADLAAIDTDVENYVFEGWYYNGEKMDVDTVITVTDDVTIEANYIGAEAKLVFKANGAIFANGSDTFEIPLNVGDEITEDMYPAVPAYEGHTFDRWSDDLVGQIMEDKEVVITIKWNVNSYNIKFVNGLTNAQIGDIVSGEFGSPVAMPELPTETGYSFAWDNTVASIPARNEKGELMVNGGTMTVTAVPTANVHTVTYMNGDAVVTTKDVAFNQPIDSAVALGTVPAGYTFLGWSLDENATAAGNLGVMPDKDVTVYAVLQAKGDTVYTVEIYKETLTDGQYEKVSTTPYENGTAGQPAPYTIDKDVEGFDYNETMSEIPETINGDGSSVLKVYYDRRIISVQIGDDEPVDVPFGSKVDIPDEAPAPSDPGQEFDKWVDEKGDEVSDPYTVPDSPDNDPVVITPTYKNRMINVYYSVNGTVIKTVATEYSKPIDSTVRPADDEVPAGYTFLGWNLDENATAVGALGNMPAKEVTVYAVLQAHTNVKYTVEIYEESLTDGVYDKVSETPYTNGTAGQPAPYEINKDVEGFDYNETMSVIPEAVSGDNTTVLKLYYDRRTISVQIGNDEPIDVPYGTEIDLPDDPDDNDPGTEFEKWVDENGDAVTDPFIVPDSEDDVPVVITPVYKNLSFNVIFIDELNGTTKSNILEYTTKIPNPGTPSAEGFEFDGWYTKAGDKYVAGTTTVPNADVTYYAKYTGLPVTYIVNVYFEKVDRTGWEDVQSELVDGVAGETAKYTETFEGFTLDTKISVTEDTIEGDSSTVLVIYFRRNDVKITVDDEEKDVPYGTEIKEEDLEKDVTVDPGYKIDKWTDAEGNEITFPVEIKGGEEFIPVIVKDTFTVKFQLEDGTPVDETTAEFGSEYAAPQAPEAPEGFTFAGWLDKAANTYYDGKIPAKDAVYVAYYTNNDEAEYTVNIYIMNTSGVEELSGSYKSTAAIGTTQSVVPGTVAFCTLDTAKSNTSCVVLADNSASINLYFVRGLYTVSFDGEETQVYAGAAIPVPADPAQDGKKFTGWTPAIPDVMPEEDLAFASTWEDVKYTITYIVNDNKIVHEYLFGEVVTPYEITEAPAGLVFDSWLGTIPETMPAENVVVSAVFKAAAYTATYLDADGNVYESYSVAYGAEIPVPATNPEKAFHEFVEWDNIPETMPNYNVTIKPVFAPIDVRLIPSDGSTTVIDRERMIIYGLEENLTAKVLDDLFLDYEGDGTLVIKPVTEGTSRYGTGAVVELYNNADGSLVETFHIVVFGDLNGDSVVNGIDVSIASDEAFWITDWSLEGSDEYNEYRTIAANLDSKNSVIDSTDVSNIKNYVLSLVDIDQTTGKIVRS